MITPEYREGLDDLASHYKEVLTLLGEDPNREGLEKTPMRVAKAMQVLTRGYSQDPHKVLTDALFKEDYNQMVLVKDIDVFSLCEHHMLPFYGKAHVAYIPNGYITGLSKIARVVDIFSHVKPHYLSDFLVEKLNIVSVSLLSKATEIIEILSDL